MVRSELVDAIAGHTGVSKKDVDIVLFDFFTTVRQEEKTMIKGFGVFRNQMTGARTARNPRTGEPVEIPARMKFSFKAARKVKNEAL